MPDSALFLQWQLRCALLTRARLVHANYLRSSIERHFQPHQLFSVDGERGFYTQIRRYGLDSSQPIVLFSALGCNIVETTAAIAVRLRA